MLLGEATLFYNKEKVESGTLYKPDIQYYINLFTKLRELLEQAYYSRTYDRISFRENTNLVEDTFMEDLNVFYKDLINVATKFEECCVCKEITAGKTPCNHSLCLICYHKIPVCRDEDADTRMSCPICRQEISYIDDC